MGAGYGDAARDTRMGHCTVIIQTHFLLFLGDINVLWMSLYLCGGKIFLNFFGYAASVLTHF